jgi:hypothetical protein
MEGTRRAILPASRSAAPFFFPAGASAIYSLRKVVKAYAGKCVNVRRLSDNTATDIGFLSSGAIDMPTALTFGAGTMLFVTKWYDQSGGGHDASQATTLGQPELLLVNGKPWIAFNITNAFCYLATAAAIGLTGDQTIGVVCQLNTPSNSAIPVLCYDGTNGWFMELNAGGQGSAGYFSTGGAVNDTSNLLAGSVHRVAVTRASGAVAVHVDGAITATGTGSNSAASTPLNIGSFSTNGDSFEGLMSEVYIYPSALSAANLSAIAASQSAYFTPTGFQSYYNGSTAVQFPAGATFFFGNVLDYEYTQSWTMFAAVQAYSRKGEQGEAAIFSNIVHSGNFTGYGVFIVLDNPTYTPGAINIRLVNNLAGPNVQVIGTTNVVDGKQHLISVSYDSSIGGGGRAAGFAAYIDGAPEALTVVSDTLAGNSIVVAGQVFAVGCQSNDAGNQIKGRVGFIQVDNVVRSQNYIQTNFTASSPPPSTANTAMRLLFSEGSGTTVHDTSGNGLNGTLSSTNMWVP